MMAVLDSGRLDGRAQSSDSVVRTVPRRDSENKGPYGAFESIARGIFRPEVEAWEGRPVANSGFTTSRTGDSQVILTRWLVDGCRCELIGCCFWQFRLHQSTAGPGSGAQLNGAPTGRERPRLAPSASHPRAQLQLPGSLPSLARQPLINNLALHPKKAPICPLVRPRHLLRPSPRRPFHDATTPFVKQAKITTYP